MESKLRPYVGVATILKWQSSVLLGYRIGKFAPNLWGFPGGKVDYGETVEEAACRELREEAGVILKQKDLKLITTTSNIFDDGSHYITVFLEGRVLTNFGIQNREPKKIREWLWFEENALPFPLMPGIVKLINIGYCLRVKDGS